MKHDGIDGDPCVGTGHLLMSSTAQLSFYFFRFPVSLEFPARPKVHESELRQQVS